MNPQSPAGPSSWQDQVQALLELHAAGSGAQALQQLERWLGQAPAHPPLLNALAVAAFHMGHLPQGIDCLGRSLAAEPNQANIWALRGAALYRCDRATEALEALNRALAQQPHLADAYFDRGCVFLMLRRLPEALADFDQTVALAPDNAAAHTNRAVVLHRSGQGQRARQAFDQALALQPRNVRALANRGALLHELGRSDEALSDCRRAVATDPNDAEARFNLGAVLDGLCLRDEAMQQYQCALTLAPGHVDANFNLSMLQLSLGNFEDGWRGFEWRWQSPRMRADAWWRDSPRQWRGASPVTGKTLLLLAEQGLGDTLQFCRYASLLAQRGAHVVLEVEHTLCDLMRTVPGVAQVIAKGEPRSAYDLVCPLLSLPLALGTTVTSIPAQVPYLRAAPDAVRMWAQRLGPIRHARVGLVWRGGFHAEHPETWRALERRNISLAQLAPLNIPGVDFFSLQKGPEAEAELTRLQAGGWDGPALADHSAQLDSFADTAALVENLDLVISVDTSTAHLAAALGKPVWLLNRFDTCWRWMLDRRDSPWYPTLTIYRQEAPSDWDTVVRAVRADLLRFAAATAPARPS